MSSTQQGRGTPLDVEEKPFVGIQRHGSWFVQARFDDVRTDGEGVVADVDQFMGQIKEVPVGADPIERNLPGELDRVKRRVEGVTPGRGVWLRVESTTMYPALILVNNRPRQQLITVKLVDITEASIAKVDIEGSQVGGR